MSLVNLCPPLAYREFTDAGAPLAGGKLYTAQPGTVAGPAQSFPKATYTDATGNVQNANPVVLDSAGQANVWLSGSYSMALYDAAGILVRATDGVAGSGGGASADSVTYIYADATSGQYNANILAANNPAAPGVYEISKIDASGNSVVITPATGTVLGAASVSLTKQGEGIRLKRYTTGNNWMVSGERQPHRGAVVYNNSTSRAANITWAAELYDTDGIHEGVTHPSRLTMPVGSAWAKFKMQTNYGAAPAGSAGDPSVFLIKNGGSGGSYVGSAFLQTAAGLTGSKLGVVLETAWIPVVAGDYFELSTSHDFMTDTTGGLNWFSVEIKSY